MSLIEKEKERKEEREELGEGGKKRKKGGNKERNRKMKNFHQAKEKIMSCNVYERIWPNI